VVCCCVCKGGGHGKARKVLDGALSRDAACRMAYLRVSFAASAALPLYPGAIGMGAGSQCFNAQCAEKGGEAMKNIDMKVQGDKLVITVDLSKSFGLSASGKSVLIASTAGNVAVPGREEVKIGLNIYRSQGR
jgi:hypothetical protein